ncbi:hypothetical protein [Succinatimonas hippei]|uniref:hypothetical protein n=1 Tax=Succinatimonas hippei TaxID=626938 RepID=UPI00255CBAD3|nr:hypothetical protein [Succinatimonas hippei]
MNIYRMTIKKIQQAIKEPLPKECQYGSIEELLIWSLGCLGARMRCDVNPKRCRQILYRASVCTRCEIEFAELYNFGPVYHKLSGKQKTVYNAIVTGKLEFDHSLIDDGVFYPLLTNTSIRGKRHGNHR